RSRRSWPSSGERPPSTRCSSRTRCAPPRNCSDCTTRPSRPARPRSNARSASASEPASGARGSRRRSSCTASATCASRRRRPPSAAGPGRTHDRSGMTYQTDPDIAALFATFDPPPAALFDESVDLQTRVDLLREGSRRDSEGSAQRPFAGTIEPIELVGRSGPIAARLYRPAALAAGVRGVAVWFYGGGMMLGDLDKAHHDAAELAEISGAPVITAAYRLAPEHPFPAGVEDAFDAVAFIARNGSRWGINTGRIAVGGESAGGAMATAAALQSVGVEDVNIVFQL